MICMQTYNTRRGKDGRLYVRARIQADTKPEVMPTDGTDITGIPAHAALDIGSRIRFLDVSETHVMGEDWQWHLWAEAGGGGGASEDPRIGVMDELTTTEHSTVVGAINEVNKTASNAATAASDVSKDLGDLSGLETEAQDTIVSAINEANKKAGDAATAAGNVSNVVGNTGDLQTQETGTVVGAINEVNKTAGDAKTAIGDVSGLETDETSDLVAAVNSANKKAGDAATAAGDISKAVGDIGDLQTQETGTVVGAINEVAADVGDLSTLDTTEHGDLVGAINEVAGYIPAGGATGDVLHKASEEDRDMIWGPEQAGLPKGGTTGQMVVKTGEKDFEAGWGDAPSGYTNPVDTVDGIYHDLNVGTYEPNDGGYRLVCDEYTNADLKDYRFARIFVNPTVKADKGIVDGRLYELTLTVKSMFIDNSGFKSHRSEKRLVRVSNSMSNTRLLGVPFSVLYPLGSSSHTLESGTVIGGLSISPAEDAIIDNTTIDETQIAGTLILYK